MQEENKKWIRVSKSLPKYGQDVLVCNNNTGDVGIADFKPSLKWSIQGSNYFEPTHWRHFDALPDKDKWYENKKKHEMPQFLKIKQTFEGATYKHFHVDGENMFYHFYQGECGSVGYKSGGGTLIHYFEPSTKEEYEAYIETLSDSNNNVASKNAADTTPPPS